MVTMKDVAIAANVSVGTVSNVINKKSNVNEHIQKHVLKTIKKLNYTVNLHAKGMAMNRSFNIGVILPSILYRYYPEVVDAIETAAEKLNFDLMVAFSKYDPKREIKIIESFASKSIDGILLVPMGQENVSYYRKFIKERGPIVFLLRRLEKIKIPYIISNNLKASHDAIKYLYEKNFKDILYITYDIERSTHKDRFDGYIEAVKKYGIKENYYISKQYFKNGFIIGYEIIKKLYNQKKLPEVIYASDDTVAIGAMKACKELGIEIPKEISLIGLGNLYPREMLMSNLTTFDPHPDKIGEKAISILNNEIENWVEGSALNKKKDGYSTDFSLIEGGTVRNNL